VASSTVAHGWSHYLVSFLGIFHIEMPHDWINSPFDFDPALGEWVVTGAVMNVPALLVVLAVTVVLVIGIRESANFNAAMVMLKLVVVCS
jgi:APA family basic amino acid/polyamine antiporter